MIGWSGTNMRYVTITKSQFWNNGTGIVPNALDSEKFPPAEDNVISNNEVFWNNFNYYLGAPFKLEGTSVGEVAYPTGVGILLYGGHRNTISNNRVYGNWLTGIGGLQAITLKDQGNATLIGNKVTGNQLGLNGTDLNGVDLFYDGDGSDNCYSSNTGVTTTMPANPAVFAPCPFSGANTFDSAAQQTAIGWAVNPDHEAGWQRHPHAAKAGYLPLEHWDKSRGDK